MFPQSAQQLFAVGMPGFDEIVGNSADHQFEGNRKPTLFPMALLPSKMLLLIIWNSIKQNWNLQPIPKAKKTKSLMKTHKII